VTDKLIKIKTKEELIINIKKLGYPGYDTHSDLILDCIKNNNIDINCDDKLCNIILDDFEIYEYKCIDLLKKFKSKFSESVVNRLIIISTAIFVDREVEQILNENVAFSFDSIKLLLNMDENNKSFFALIKTILKTIKNNGHKQDEYTHVINNFKYDNNLPYEILNNTNKQSSINNYTNMLHIAIKHNFIPTNETLEHSIVSDNKMLMCYCMNKNVEPSFKCYETSLYYQKNDLLNYYLAHDKTIITQKHLVAACEDSDEYMNIILDMKIIPNYDCVKNCINNSLRLKKLCDNGLQINEDIIELFIENNIDKKLWSHVDVHTVFDKCHHMNIKSIFIDYSTTPEYILYDKIQQCKYEFDCCESMLSTHQNNIELNTYHYDLIFEYFVACDEVSKDYIIKAINDKKYNITKKSIYRISDNINRYKIAKIFDKYIN
jgi:hypothetical protein